MFQEMKNNTHDESEYKKNIYVNCFIGNNGAKWSLQGLKKSLTMINIVLSRYRKSKHRFEIEIYVLLLSIPN